MANKFDDSARFDDSFLNHMVRDFFFVLLVVIVVELGFRFSLVWYDFHNESKGKTERAAKQLFDGGLRWEELPTEWVGALSLGLASLRSLSVEKGLPKALQQKLDHSSNDLNALIDQGRALPQQRQLTGKQLVELSHRFHEISHFISEMAVLDEKMREIAEEGQSLLGRLRKM